MTRPESIDPRTHRALAGVSRVRVLEFLRARGGDLTAAEVATEVGLHPNTVRLHLDQLTDAGLVTRRAEPRRSPGRPRLLFAAAPSAPGDRDDDGYRVLAGILAGQLEQGRTGVGDEAAAAGRVWARTLPPAPGPRPVSAAEATAHVVRLMDGLGFAPTAAPGSGVIELHRCPFRQVAEQHSRVVCGVHLGLLQGALDDLGAPVRATGLEPFVTPDLCLAHLTSDDGATGTAAAASPPTERPVP